AGPARGPRGAAGVAGSRAPHGAGARRADWRGPLLRARRRRAAADGRPRAGRRLLGRRALGARPHGDPV
ncbi:MAG: hypothetical protein AVDCRST_MAG68-4258, partial [uncultured Gemmatimonadetes bacterium]